MPFEADDTARLLNDLPEPFLVVSLEGEVLFVNRALLALTGYTSSELLGGDVAKLLPTPARRRVQVLEWFGRWAKDDHPEQLRYLNLELVSKSGEVRLVSVRVSIHQQKHGACFMVVLHDVTTQQETLSSLRHAQLITNRILAIGEDAILSVDHLQRIIYWNPRAEALFGYKASEIIGQPLDRLLPADIAKDHARLVGTFASGSHASRMMGQRGEIYGLHKQGHLIPLEASITKTTIDGEVILSAQVRDITERKRRERTLVESEARFRAIFEHAIEAMALLSPTGEVLEINPAARAMLPAFLPQKFLWQLDWWFDEEDSASIEQSRHALESGVGRCAKGEVIRMRRVLGAREIDFSMIPVAGPDGRVIYIIAEGRDVTVRS